MMNKINFKQLFQYLIILLFGVFNIFLYYQDKLSFFINPRYIWFSFAASIVAVIAGVLGIIFSLRLKKKKQGKFSLMNLIKSNISMDLFVIFILIAGLIISPKQLSSVTAVQRATDSSNINFSGSTQSNFFDFDYSTFTIGDWSRSLSLNPDLDFYKDKPVNVTGFVYQDPAFSSEYFFVGRFWVVCCAVDATPLSLLVKGDLPENIKPDDWVDISGDFEIEEVAGSKRVVIIIDQIEKVEQPSNPYIF